MFSSQGFSEFLQGLYQYSPFSMLSLFILVLCRLGPIVTFAPFLGAKLPNTAKMGLLIILSLVFLPHVAMTSQTAVPYSAAFILLIIKEVFWGFVLSFLIIIPFQFAQTAGSLVDFMRGASSLQISDPFSNTQTSSIGNLYNYVLIAIFYMIGGPFYFFSSIMTSYSLLPADGLINPIFFDSLNPFWHVIIAVASKVLALAIQLSAPALLAILMTEVFLGIANRLAPQVQIAFLGMSLKSLLGLTLLCLGWLFILQQVEKQTILWLKEVDKVLFMVPAQPSS